MCNWLRRFFHTHVEKSIFKRSDSGLCDEFRRILQDRRSIHFPWAEKWIAGLAGYCHPFYTTFVPFRGFTGGLHKDKADTPLSILIHFGQHAVLHLPRYDAKVELQPLDIVFFRSCELEHKVTQHQSYVNANTSVATRFAVTCFFRREMMKHTIPTEFTPFQHTTTNSSQGRQTRSSRRRQHQDAA